MTLAWEDLEICDFLDVLADGLIVIDREQRIVLINRAAEEMWGFSSAKLVGQPLNRLIPFENRAQHVEFLKTISPERTGKCAMAGSQEVLTLRKDGTEFPVTVKFGLVRDRRRDVSYWIANVTDRSDINKAQQNLRDIEQLNTKIIEFLNDGVLLIDKEGRTLSCNASAEKILQISRDQLAGRSAYGDEEWSLFHEDGAAWRPEEYPVRVTLETRRALRDITLGVNRREKNMQWLMVNTHPMMHPGEQEPYAALVTFADVTERFQMYQLLQERITQSTRELAALLEISRNLVSTLDLAPLLTNILVQLKQVIQYAGAAVIRFDGSEFSVIEYLGPVPREMMLQFRVPLDLDSGYRRVMLARSPVLIADIWEDDPWLKSLHKVASADLRAALGSTHAWMGIPLIAQGDFIGVLRLDHTQPGFFNQHDADLLTSFAELAAIALRNADLYENAQKLAALEERQKLARELHDSVSQALYGIALGVRTARTLLDTDPPKAATPLDYSMHLAETGLAEMRALIFELRPESLEKEGLVGAFSKQATALTARYGWEVVTQCDAEPALPILVKEAIYRIVQEALNNVVRHAQARRVFIRMQVSDHEMQVEVEDDGQGFDPSVEKPGHIGLGSMRERAQRIAAEFGVASQPGQGTRVWLRLPL